MDAGIPPEQILTETHSYDTIGNAFFSRVLHVDPLGLRRLLIITSDFHLPRTEAAFRWVYGLEPAASPYDLHFEGVADPGMDPEVLRERESRERLAGEKERLEGELTVIKANVARLLQNETSFAREELERLEGQRSDQEPDCGAPLWNLTISWTAPRPSPTYPAN